MTVQTEREASIRTIERDEWGDSTYVEGWAPSCGAFCWEHEGTNRQLRDRLRDVGFTDTAILAALGEADQFLMFVPPFVPPAPPARRRFPSIRSLIRRSP